jgi:hypothetical protein
VSVVHFHENQHFGSFRPDVVRWLPAHALAGSNSIKHVATGRYCNVGPTQQANRWTWHSRGTQQTDTPGWKLARNGALI